MKSKKDNITLETEIQSGDKNRVNEYIQNNGLRKSINPITFIDEKEKNEKIYKNKKLQDK